MSNVRSANGNEKIFSCPVNRSHLGLRFAFTQITLGYNAHCMCTQSRGKGRDIVQCSYSETYADN